MRIQIAELCPCGAHLTLSDELPATALPYRYSLLCSRCYEPSEDPSDSDPRGMCLGYGTTPEAAYDDWWDFASDAWNIRQMGFAPAPLFAELSEQAGDEAERQHGWGRMTTALHNWSYWYGPVKTVEVAP